MTSAPIGQEGPAHWEADVVLRDGRPCHVRPIAGSDAGRLRAFHASLSAQTVYFRFFAPRPSLTDAEVEHFTVVDHVDRVALVATMGDDIIGVGRYERIAPTEAEVAFVIRDEHQGRGLGSVLLEHLAAAARENGVERFVADVLPENRRMQATFEEAGFRTTRRLDDGFIAVHFDIEPTARMRQVMLARERAAEARSIRRLLTPGVVAVIGASRTAGSAGHEVLRHLRDGGFAGEVFAVHPETDTILGFPVLRSVAEAPVPVDLAVVVVRADTVLEVVDECAAAGVRGLVVMSLGFAESGDEGRARQRELVRRARGNGMRVVGPGALGMVNTDPHLRLNASLAAEVPGRGRLGFFCQSGGLGSVILHRMVDRGLGVSSFVSAGNRADVSGNDLLQYWSEDESTDAVLLYLESVGNPRKFARICRQLGRLKPVVAVRSGRTSQAIPLGHRVRVTSLPPAAVDAVFEQSGVVQTDSLRSMLDVAQILASQPAPASGAVAVIATAEALAVLAADAVLSAGLRVAPSGTVLAQPLDAHALERAIVAADADADTGSVLVVHVPPLPGDLHALRDGLVAAAPHLTTTLIAVSLSTAGEKRPDGRTAPWIGPGAEAGVVPPGSVPLFGTVEDAARALASVVGHARWRARSQEPAPELSDDAVGAVEAECERLCADHEITVPLTDARALLACAGVELGSAVSDNHATVDCRVRIVVDELFGPVVSFGLDGEVPELLGDRSWAIPPLSAATAADMRTSLRAAPLLERPGGAVDVNALDELLVNVGMLADAAPGLRGLDLLVRAHSTGLHLVSGDLVLGPADTRDVDSRRAM